MSPARPLLVLGLSFVAACGPGGQIESTPTEHWDAADFEHDLVLEVSPTFEVALQNRSTSRTYPVVIPGDGSEADWREPHVWFTVERRDGNAWKEIAPAPTARCGLFSADWTKDVTELTPGAVVKLRWFPLDRGRFASEGARELRVTAHYAYGKHPRPDAPVALRGVPSYALASAPVVIQAGP